MYRYPKQRNFSTFTTINTKREREKRKTVKKCTFSYMAGSQAVH
jgi:hypothetical protein